MPCGSCPATANRAYIVKNVLYSKILLNCQQSSGYNNTSNNKLLVTIFRQKLVNTHYTQYLTTCIILKYCKM